MQGLEAGPQPCGFVPAADPFGGDGGRSHQPHGHDERVGGEPGRVDDGHRAALLDRLSGDGKGHIGGSAAP